MPEAIQFEVSDCVVIRRLSETNEWRVTYRHLRGERREATAYYTNDKQDALNTAALMAAACVPNLPQ